MRVLLTTDPIGGVWTFTKELARELLSRGHEVYLVSFGGTPSAAQSSWANSVRSTYGEAFHFHPSSVPLEWMNTNGHIYEAGVLLLRDVAADFHPDLVHSNQFCFGNLPFDVPAIITAHSDVLSWAASCRPDGLEPSAWLSEYRRLVARGLEAASAVVAPTGWMLGALSENFSWSCPARVILNGRNLQPCNSSEKCLQAVSVGRLWDEAKNIDSLSHLHFPLPVFIAGEQSHELSSMAGAKGQLRFLGLLDEAELLSLFNRSSVYIAASRYEPFGLAPLEAALCGCAIVANDIPSLREIWGDHALYFHDVTSLEKLLHQLCESPVDLLQARMKTAIRARELTATRMADGYVALYEEILGSKSSGIRELAAYAC